MKKFEQIDGLRFFAVFGVVAIHYGWRGIDFCYLISSGSKGVDLFFVISGFLITLGLLRSRLKEESKKQSLFKFYVRRFLRIFPVYYLFLFLLWFLDHDKVAPGLKWYLTYTSNFYCLTIPDWPGVGHLWSLAVEEQFYLGWPLLILILPARFLPWTMGGAVLSSIAIKIFWYATSPLAGKLGYVGTISCLDTLALGGLLAWFYLNYPDYLRKVLNKPAVPLLIVAQLLLIESLKYVPAIKVTFDIMTRFSFGLLAAWLIGKAAFGFRGVAGAVLSFRPFRYLGQISYAIYLIHPMLPDILGMGFSKNENFRALVYVVVDISAASLSWYLFEKPILRLKDHFE